MARPPTPATVDHPLMVDDSSTVDSLNGSSAVLVSGSSISVSCFTSGLSNL